MNYNFDNNIPIYIQIAERIRIQIISGEIKTGDRLQSVRELAINLKVNPNTIQKALQELEDEKLIYTERTNGKFVTNDNKLIEKTKDDLALKKTKVYLDSMKSIGITLQDAINYLEDMKGR